jgi:hypothetical protein
MLDRPSSSVLDANALLLRVLCDPAQLPVLPPAEMDLAIRLLRRARLLGRVAAQLQDLNLEAGLPAVVADQLESARINAEARQRAALWEVDRVAWALRHMPDVPLVLMKGCAYALAGLPNARGRSFADVDLMVPVRHLPEVETALRARAWASKELTPYDDQYYRRWAHELPPMIHAERDVEVDLHHNILMRTARLKPSPELLLTAARDLSSSRFKSLAPADMVLHAMVHLFYGGEMDDALRELVDIDDLLRHFGAFEPGFWHAFWARAEVLDISRPAYYGLRYASRMLGTPIPVEVMRAAAVASPSKGVVAVMDRLVPVALFPKHPDRRSSRRVDRARVALYLRSHWVKMPPAMLARHLSRKIHARLTGTSAGKTSPGV